MTPGSTAPQRVPIMRPSTAVNPIVAATLRPSFTPQRRSARARAEARSPLGGTQETHRRAHETHSDERPLLRNGAAARMLEPDWIGYDGRLCRNRQSAESEALPS